MKILANLGLIKKTDANLPFGKTIQDETDTQPGTPIVADLMRDLFSNFYRLLELAKITPTNDFDGDDSQYQLIDALKKLPNSMNDIEQVLTLNDTTWSVPLDLSILPNKYVFFARPTDDYDTEVSYTFKGTGTTEYSFTSQNKFTTGEVLMVVIDTSGVRVYPTNKPKYKVYTALLTQSGTNAPTAVVLENTLGENINWGYTNPGDYTFIPFNISFPLDKTFIIIGNNFINGINVSPNSATVISDAFLEIITTNELLVPSNNMLNSTPIEIRVYN